MSKINELIEALCPEGVPFKKLGEIGSFYGGLTGKSKDDFKDGNAVFITYMNVFSNIELKINVTDRVRVGENEKQNIVQYGDILFTGSSETPNECGMSSVLTTHTDEKLYLNSFCFGYRFHDPEMFLPGFTKHLFRSDDLRYQITRTASGVTRFNVSKRKMKDVRVPVPPLEVQREIVRVLDNFTLLSALLSAELSARRKQYEYYRNELLTFGDYIPSCQLRDIVNFRNGKGHEKDISANGKYIVVNSKFISTNGDVKKYTNKQICPLYVDDILMVMSDLPNGRALAKCYLVDEDDKYSLNQRIGAFHVKTDTVRTRFLLHVLNRNRQLLAYDNGVDQTNLKKDEILNITIPIPNIEIQDRLVYALDHFEAICSDLDIGLPAEIETRQKQYEYYRDILLTFAETGNSILTDRQTDRQTDSQTDRQTDRLK